MEGILFLIMLAGTVLAVRWASQNDRRAPGTLVMGLFAYLPGREPQPPKSFAERLRLERGEPLPPPSSRQ